MQTPSKKGFSIDSDTYSLNGPKQKDSDSGSEKEGGKSEHLSN